MKALVRGLVGLSALLAAAGSASASQQVYHFVNPTFGGNPLNGSFLLSTANAQGFGPQSGQSSPDLSGLNSALSNLGSNLGSSTGAGSVGTPIIVIPSGTTTTTTNGTIP